MANKKVQQLTAVENKQNDKSKINWKKQGVLVSTYPGGTSSYPGYRFGLRLHP